MKDLAKLRNDEESSWLKIQMLGKWQKKRGVYFCLKISICLINSDVTFKEMGTIIQTVDEFIINEILWLQMNKLVKLNN